MRTGGTEVPPARSKTSNAALARAEKASLFMVIPHQNVNGNGHRRPHGSYKAPIATRAVAAAVTAEENNWSTRETSALFGVCPPYVGTVRSADEDTRKKLLTGEMTLAQLHKQRLQQRAEQRAQRRAEEEREAEQWIARQAQAQTRRIDLLINDVGFKPVIDRIIERLGPENAAYAFNGQLEAWDTRVLSPSASNGHGDAHHGAPQPTA
jgi:hypothetical protein